MCVMYVYLCIYTYVHISLYVHIIMHTYLCLVYMCVPFPVFSQIFCNHCFTFFFSENIMIDCRITTFNINEMLPEIKA